MTSNVSDLFFLNEYELPVLVRGDVKIEWVNLNEGNNGDYDSEDSSDQNLLRFDASYVINGEWEPVEDGSFCTQVPAGTNGSDLKKMLVQIMDESYDDLSVHRRAKRTLESFSWICA